MEMYLCPLRVESSVYMTEATLLAAIKKLAVKQESKLAHRIKMGKAIQSPGVTIRTFHAQLKGLATACEYTITSQCQCTRTSRTGGLGTGRS